MSIWELKKKVWDVDTQTCVLQLQTPNQPCWVFGPSQAPQHPGSGPQRLDVPEWTQNHSFKTLFEWSYSEEWPWQPLGQFRCPVPGDTAVLALQPSVAIPLIWLIEVHKAGAGNSRNIQDPVPQRHFHSFIPSTPSPAWDAKGATVKLTGQSPRPGCKPGSIPWDRPGLGPAEPSSLSPWLCPSWEVETNTVP